MIKKIEEATGLPIKISSVRGAHTTTMAVGGAYKYFVEPDTSESLALLVTLLRNEGQQYRILGAGSNLVVCDNGVEEWVIRLGRGFQNIKQNSAGEFYLGGSTSLMRASRELSEKGFSGIEFAGGIPASIGGAVRMNAGAHGASMSGILKKIFFIDAEGKPQEVLAMNLAWGYRHSEFSNGSIVTGVVVELEEEDPKIVSENRTHFLAERKARQPLQYPSSGSIFKNPGVGDRAAGAYLERAGCKGLTIGDAAVSELHANWIINPRKKASARDVEALIDLCKKKVLDHEGTMLEREVLYWGSSPIQV